MKENFKKKIKKIFGYFNLTPYVYYVFKFNDPFIIKKKLFSNKAITIFDVGANDGRSIDLYRKEFPKSTIYSFEPTPSIFQNLNSKYQSIKNVFVYNLALSSKIGTLEFYINKSSLTNSLLQISDNNIYNLKTINKILVETTTIDGFCKNKNINQIDILKIDVQGADLDVLKGAEKMLENKKIKLIFVEVEFVELYKDQPLFHDISIYLYSLGYKLHYLHNLSTSKKANLFMETHCFNKINENILIK